MILTHPTAKIIHALIAQLGLNSGGWGLGYGTKMPPAGASVPSNYIYVFGSSDVNDGQIKMPGGLSRPLLGYGFQIRVRATQYDIGDAKMKQIVLALNQVEYQNLTISAVTYTIKKLVLQGGILPMGQQEQSLLEHFSSNWIAKMEEV